MIKEVKEFFINTNSENELVQMKQAEPKQKYMDNTEKIDLNEQEIKNLYVRVCLKHSVYGKLTIEISI